MSDTARNHDFDTSPAWAVWIGPRKNIVSVTADTEQEAIEKACDEADADPDDVNGVDGPFQDATPAVYEFTFYEEHKQVVTVEAPYEDYAEDVADSKRTPTNSEYMRTTHTEKRRIEKDTESTSEGDSNE